MLSLSTQSYFISYWYNDLTPNDIIFAAEDSFTSEAGPFVTDGGDVLPGFDQLRIAREGRAAWYLTLIGAQAFHIFFVRSRFSKFTERNRDINNLMIAGVIFEIAVALSLIYIDGLNDVRSQNKSLLLWSAVGRRARMDATISLSCFCGSSHCRYSRWLHLLA